MLAATYAKQVGRTVAFSLAAFRQAFAGGRDLGDTDTVLIAAAACEMHPAAVLRAHRAAVGGAGAGWRRAGPRCGAGGDRDGSAEHASGRDGPDRAARGRSDAPVARGRSEAGRVLAGGARAAEPAIDDQRRRGDTCRWSAAPTPEPAGWGYRLRHERLALRVSGPKPSPESDESAGEPDRRATPSDRAAQR